MRQYYGSGGCVFCICRLSVVGGGGGGVFCEVFFIWFDMPRCIGRLETLLEWEPDQNSTIYSRKRSSQSPTLKS
jgi:hypothetical protein